MIGTKMVPEMFVVFNQMTWLIAQEDIVEENVSHTRRGELSTYFCHITKCQDTYQVDTSLNVNEIKNTNDF